MGFFRPDPLFLVTCGRWGTQSLGELLIVACVLRGHVRQLQDGHRVPGAPKIEFRAINDCGHEGDVAFDETTSTYILIVIGLHS